MRTVTNQRLMQAYQQAPWRIQIQRIAIFMLILISTGFTAGLYLSVSARAATAAIQTRKLENLRDTIKQSNASLEAELALMLTTENLKSRAQELGYEPLNTERVQFLKIATYPGKQPVILAPPPSVLRPAKPLIRSIYTRSLWDALVENVTKSGVGNGES